MKLQVSNDIPQIFWIVLGHDYDKEKLSSRFSPLFR